jgi:hypothetical protein
MRAVREIAMGWSLERGGLFLHAAAVAFGRRGLVLAGTKGAGKTTLLLHLLGEPGAAYLSNDRVLVHRGKEPVEIRGMPTIATIRPRTLDLLPELGSRIRASGFQHRLTLAEIAADESTRAGPWDDGRYGLSPAQLCRLVGVAAQPTAECAGLLFPAITKGAVGLEVSRMGSEAAAERLADALFGIRTWRKASDAFRIGRERMQPTPQALEEQCRQLTAATPCWECHLGEDAYSSRAATARALASLLGRAPTPR